MGDFPQETAPEAAALSRLQELIGYQFKNPALLKRALTHRSYVNESEGEGEQHNESLEFLGDAVLGFLVSSMIYRRFPELTEGELSKNKGYLVSATILRRLAERLRLGEFLRLGRGEEKTGGRAKRAILVDACEAIIGAIYLDGSIEAASSFVESHLTTFVDAIDRRQLNHGDFKSALQERLHGLGLPDPVYSVVAESGPDHHKTFVVRVAIGRDLVAEGSGPTKKEAQQEAARRALQELQATPAQDADAL